MMTFSLKIDELCIKNDECNTNEALASSHMVHQPAAKAGDMLIFTCGPAAYFLLFGLFSTTFSPKTGALWVNLAERAAICNVKSAVVLLLTPWL